MKKALKPLLGIISAAAIFLALLAGSMPVLAANAPDSINLAVWTSKTGMGEETADFTNRDTIYLCYEITDVESGRRLDAVCDTDYSVDMTFMKRDGTEIGSYTYDNDNNWISISQLQGGIYYGRVSVHGTYEGSFTTAFKVTLIQDVPRVSMHVWVSGTGMGEEKNDFTRRDTTYLCYELTDADTGRRLDSDHQLEYTVNMEILDMSGRVLFPYTYTNDNNWISISGLDAGTYYGRVFFTCGDISQELDAAFSVYR